MGYSQFGYTTALVRNGHALFLLLSVQLLSSSFLEPETPNTAANFLEAHLHVPQAPQKPRRYHAYASCWQKHLCFDHMLHCILRRGRCLFIALFQPSQPWFRFRIHIVRFKAATQVGLLKSPPRPQ
ncbi:hypothetical protein DFH08DRAFT_329894 [Mycena albidolilacea]|uniref:Secreted protein n=1 Tax=Mycena albidolilacea TaxID=1033008 RepID=A0AAD7F360_9AGAR|nr:hypothetical protein DFH08DRAFT_329894 [Mycena albidolilacea]